MVGDPCGFVVSIVDADRVVPGIVLTEVAALTAVVPSRPGLVVPAIVLSCVLTDMRSDSACEGVSCG